MATQKTHRQLLAVTSRTSWASFCGDISRSLLPPERDAVRHHPHLWIPIETPLGAGFPANLEPIQGHLTSHLPQFCWLWMRPWIFCNILLQSWIYPWDITNYIFPSFNVFTFTSNSVSLHALFGGLCDHSQIFLSMFTPIFHNWTTPIFSGVPALRYFTVYIFANDHFLFWALSVRHFTEPFCLRI